MEKFPDPTLVIKSFMLKKKLDFDIMATIFQCASKTRLEESGLGHMEHSTS